MTLFIHRQTITEHMPHHTQAMLGIVMIHIAVYLILVDMLGKQLTDDIEYFRIVGIKGKTACISHHATIHGDGEMLTQFIKQSQLPDNAEHQFARTRHLRM